MKMILKEDNSLNRSKESEVQREMRFFSQNVANKSPVYKIKTQRRDLRQYKSCMQVFQNDRVSQYKNFRYLIEMNKNPCRNQLDESSDGEETNVYGAQHNKILLKSSISKKNILHDIFNSNSKGNHHGITKPRNLGDKLIYKHLIVNTQRSTTQ